MNKELVKRIDKLEKIVNFLVERDKSRPISQSEFNKIATTGYTNYPGIPEKSPTI